MRNFIPRPYQKMAVEYILKHRRCALWMGMGLGKTSSVLEAIRIIKTKHKDLKVLIVAPLRVAQSTWPDEQKKWAEFSGLKVSVVCGTEKARLAALKAEADIYTTNYEQIPWLTRQCHKHWPFDLIVADESTRLKGFRARQGTLRAKALSRVAFLSKGFIELSGTPAPNGLADLWGQIWFLDGGRALGPSFSAFQRRFFYQVGGPYDPYSEWVLRDGSEEEIRKVLKPITLTVNPEDYFDVAQNITNDIVVELPKETMKQYRKFAREFYLEIGNDVVTAENAAVKSLRLLQLASGAVYKEDSDNDEYAEFHDAKIEALKSVIEEANGAPVLCAYNFRHEVERIKKAIPKARLLDKNPQTITDWNAGKIPLLLAHPASCGHGLNLQDGGNILVFFSCGWSLELHDQIIERIGAVRQAQAGHKRSSFIHYIVAKGTLDEVVKARLATKREVLDALLEKRNEILGDEEC